MNTTTTTVTKVQIVEIATGRVTREDWAGGLTPRQRECLIRNYESAVRGDGTGRYEVRTV